MLYNFGMNDCLRELVQLNVKLHNIDFNNALSAPSLYKNGQLHSSKLNKNIQGILENHLKRYPHLQDFTSSLNYASEEKFHHSYFNALKNLNFSEL